MDNRNRFSEFGRRLNKRAEDRLTEKAEILKANSEDNYQLNVNRAELLKVISNQLIEKNIFNHGLIESKAEIRQKIVRNYLKNQKDQLSKYKELRVELKEENIKSAHKKIERTKDIDSERQKFIFLTMADDFNYIHRIALHGDALDSWARAEIDHNLGQATGRLCNNWFTLDNQIALSLDRDGGVGERYEIILYFYYRYQGPPGSMQSIATVFPYGFYSVDLHGINFVTPLGFVNELLGADYGRIELDVRGRLNVDIEDANGEAVSYIGDPDIWHSARVGHGLLVSYQPTNSFGGDEKDVSGRFIPVVKNGDLIIASIQVNTYLHVEGNAAATAKLNLDVQVPFVSLVVTPF